MHSSDQSCVLSYCTDEMCNVEYEYSYMNLCNEQMMRNLFYEIGSEEHLERGTCGPGASRTRCQQAYMSKLGAGGG